MLRCFDREREDLLLSCLCLHSLAEEVRVKTKCMRLVSDAHVKCMCRRQESSVFFVGHDHFTLKSLHLKVRLTHDDYMCLLLSQQAIQSSSYKVSTEYVVIKINKEKK